MRSLLAGTTVPNVTRLPAPKAAQTTHVESPKTIENPDWVKSLIEKLDSRESDAASKLEAVQAALVSEIQQKADGDAALAALKAKLEAAEKRVTELTAELAKTRVPAKAQPVPQIVMSEAKPDDRGWIMVPKRDSAGELLHITVKRPE